MRQSTNRHSIAEPQVWFRIIHVAEDGHHRALGDATREQAVETKGAFRNGNVGAVTRRVAADRVVTALPELRGGPKPPKELKTPRVVELLQKAMRWRTLLEFGQVRNQAEIARREGITRARVTQIMRMLRLAPEIQEHILSLPGAVRRSSISERALRDIAQLEDPKQQLAEFRGLSSVVDP